MGVEQELTAAASAARSYLEPGEELAGVLASEPARGVRVYLCAYRRDERLSWLALDGRGSPLADLRLVREAVSIVGLCELAEESAGGGDVPGLRRRLLELRETENPVGIEEAERAAAQLEAVIAAQPRVATPEYLDELGAAARRLEQALGEVGQSPFARAMAAGSGAVQALAEDVERNYKRPAG